MPINPFSSSGGNLTGLATDMRPVTPSDSADIVEGATAIAITCKTAAGNVVVVTEQGNERTYPITLGEVLPVGIRRVKSTNTTATGIWAFFV